MCKMALDQVHKRISQIPGDEYFNLMIQDEGSDPDKELLPKE